MKYAIKKIIKKFPYIGTLLKEIEIYKKGYPPGHYYSPVVDVDEVKKHQEEIFGIRSKALPSINLNEEKQLQLLHDLLPLYSSVSFESEKKDKFRYYYNNDAYKYSDGIFLSLLIRHFKPARIIEIGSGFSSAVMMDTNQHFFHNAISLTFIEPYPQRLFSLYRNDDSLTNTIFEKKLQDVNNITFQQLEEGDFLFVDSTHVSKTGSDVNKILFEILPLLNKGVFIHFHDIFFPFEYPREWVLGWSGFGWNEIYMLKAFLMHNKDYEIVLFNTYLEHFHEQWFKENMPLCLQDRGGSIWLKKLV